MKPPRLSGKPPSLQAQGAPLERERRRQREGRDPAKELFANLEELTPDQRLAVVRIATEYQTWALCELAVEKSLSGEAEAWAELAVEISEYVGGTKEWQNRVRGYALAAKAGP